MSEGIRIVVECPECGETRMPPDEVTVRACLDTEAWSYRFTCPKCRLRTVGSCPTTHALLGAVRAGAGFEAWALPAELGERPTGPPINLVDALELHRLLLEPDWFAELADGMDLDTAV
jgi:hypothetical protein